MKDRLVLTKLVLHVQVKQPVSNVLSAAEGNTVNFLSPVDIPRAAEYSQWMLIGELMRSLYNLA